MNAQIEFAKNATYLTTVIALRVKFEEMFSAMDYPSVVKVQKIVDFENDFVQEVLNPFLEVALPLIDTDAKNDLHASIADAAASVLDSWVLKSQQKAAEDVKKQFYYACGDIKSSDDICYAGAYFQEIQNRINSLVDLDRALSLLIHKCD